MLDKPVRLDIAVLACLCVLIFADLVIHSARNSRKPMLLLDPVSVPTGGTGSSSGSGSGNGGENRIIAPTALAWFSSTSSR